MKTNTQTLTPQIYVADLGAYNAGYLHGLWIDATQDEDDIHAEIQALLKASPVGEEAEEWAIHDYSDFWEASLGEYASIASIVETARFLEEHGRLGAKLIAYCDRCLERAQQAIEDHYCGEFSSVADFAQGLTEDTVQIPKSLIHYIDYESMARDLELSGDIFTIEIGFHEVHIFWNF